MVAHAHATKRMHAPRRRARVLDHPWRVHVARAPQELRQHQTFELALLFTKPLHVNSVDYLEIML